MTGRIGLHRPQVMSSAQTPADGNTYPDRVTDQPRSRHTRLTRVVERVGAIVRWGTRGHPEADEGEIRTSPTGVEWAWKMGQEGS